MANDYDDKISVGVELTPVEESPDITINKLTKDLLKRLKNGYIEVPAKIEFEGATGSLKKAQADFANKWKNMASKY